MARKPKVVKDDEQIKRSVTFPGGLYNRFVELATKERRDVNAQLLIIMEEFVKSKEKEPGPLMPAGAMP